MRSICELFGWLINLLEVTGSDIITERIAIVSNIEYWL